MKIQEAVEFVFRIENIRSRQDLDDWCGKVGRQKLYTVIRLLANEHWMRVRTPECIVRAKYEMRLAGYKLHTGI
jgi:hypothetical protein